MADDSIFETAEDEELGDKLYETDDSSQPTPDALYDEPVAQRTPNTRNSRVSGEQFISFAWAGVGSALVSRRIDVPVGRVITLEAGVAGAKIDNLIAHTWIDRLLQPFFASADKWEDFGALIAFPVIVGLYERKPGLAPVLAPAMEQMAETVLIEIANHSRKTAIKNRRAAKTMAGVNEMFEVPKGVNPVNYILKGLFADPDEQQPGEASDATEE